MIAPLIDGVGKAKAPMPHADIMRLLAADA